LWCLLSGAPGRQHSKWHEQIEALLLVTSSSVSLRRGNKDMLLSEDKGLVEQEEHQVSLKKKKKSQE
jgi:hypothetical protein